MKKTLLLCLILALSPLVAFAEFGLGAAAFYKSPVLIGNPVDIDNLNVHQFSFGGDARFNISLFQVEALVLGSWGSLNSINLYLDAGLVFDEDNFIFSVGAGPNLSYCFAENSLAQLGLNAKLSLDYKLGPISLGITYIMGLNLDNGINVATMSGLLGTQLLFWL